MQCYMKQLPLVIEANVFLPDDVLKALERERGRKVSCRKRYFSANYKTMRLRQVKDARLSGYGDGGYFVEIGNEVT